MPQYPGLCVPSEFLPRRSPKQDFYPTNIPAYLAFTGLEPVGVAGPREAVARFLVDQCSLPEDKGAQMLREKDGLLEGLYLWLPGEQLSTAARRCYVVIWPSNDTFAGTEHRCTSSPALHTFSV